MKTKIKKIMRKKSLIILSLLLFPLFSSSIIFLNKAPNTTHSKAELDETPNQSYILPDFDLSGTKYIEPFP